MPHSECLIATPYPLLASRWASLVHATGESQVADSRAYGVTIKTVRSCSGDLMTRSSATKRLAVTKVRVGDCG